MMIASPLEHRISCLPCWNGPARLAPLKGGISNISYVVTAAGQKYVARCGDDIAVHHVSRERERAVSEAAFKAGLSPELVYAEPGIMVFRFIDAAVFEENDMGENIARIVPMLRKTHREVGRLISGAPGFFWVFHVIRDYAHTLKAANARAVGDLPAYVRLANALEDRQLPMPIVFGHHDLLPGNFLDDGRRLWLIDWEYGGFGTPLFDLANVAANGGFSEAEEQTLLESYFEKRADEALLLSFDAMKIASSLREAMWAMVSEIHLNAPGADYVAHANEYLRRSERAVKRFTEKYGPP